MSGKRQSIQATDDREMILECKAAYLSVFDDIKDEIDSKEKLVQVLQQAGRNPTTRTISKYWKKSTENLSFDEFVDICRKELPTSKDDLMKAFRKIDLNGDGFLSVEELMKVLTTKGEKMSRSEVEKMIKEVDEDGNGKLDYGEVIEEDHFFYNKFCNMVMSTTEECKRKSLKMMERKERKKEKADKEAMMAFQSPQTSVNAESTTESTTKMGSTASVRSQLAEPKHSPLKSGSTVSLRSQKAAAETESNTKMGSSASLRSQMAEPKHSASKTGSTVSLRSQNVADETQSTTKMGSSASLRSQMAEPKHSASKTGSTVSLRSQIYAVDETQNKEDSVKESGAEKSDEEAESKTEFQSRHKSKESFTKDDMEKETKTEEQENKMDAGEEIEEEIHGSRVSLKMEKNPQPVPRKESVSKAVSVGEMGSKTLLTNSLKSAENVTGSQTSLRSAGQMGSRRSLISIEKEYRMPLPPPRTSLLRTLSEDDFPKPSPRARKDSQKTGPSVKHTKLSKPQNLKEWTHVTSKGAFFFEEDEIVTHLYSLEIPEDTNVYITIQPTEIPGGGGIKQKNIVDTMLYLLRSQPDENGKKLVTFTEQRDSNGKYVLRSDLSAGKYQLIPFTTGCRFKQRTSQPKKVAKIIETGEDDKIVITNAFRKALEDIFHICDLDGNGYLSRDEFNWFNVRTSGEEIADDEWDVVEERVELMDGEITLNGFVKLNEMEAEDSEGDTDDLWMTLSSMGFNKALLADELCTYRIDVYTEECDDAEFKVTGIESLAEKLEAEICQSVIDKGKAIPVKGMKDLVMYTYTSGTRAAIVLENKSRSTVKMEVDCSRSKNCVSHRGNLDYKMDLSPHSTMAAHHILPEDDSAELVLQCTETVLK